MATLAFGAVGAIGTSALGLGAGIGWLAGTLVANLFFPSSSGQDVTNEGSRLGDLTVSSSAFGAFVPIGYGTVRTSGNMIWSTGIIETRHEETSSVGGTGGKGGMGGGGSTQTNVTYTYSCSFAMAFGEGPAEDILRIWADSKLIYDKTGTGQIATQEIAFRFYPGDEDQEPDSIIMDDVGEDDCPAYRGTCYVVFDDLQLADFGNRVPNITAEITFNKGALCPQDEFDWLTSGSPSTADSYSLNVDPERGRCYLSYLTSDLDNSGFHAFDWWNTTEIQRVTSRSASSTQTIADGGPSHRIIGMDSDGYLYCPAGSWNSRPLLKIDGNSLREVARFGSLSSSTSNTQNTIVSPAHITEIKTMGPTGIERILVVGSGANDISFLEHDMGMIAYQGLEGLYRTDESVIGGMCTGKMGEAWITAYYSSGTTVALYKATAAAGAGSYGGVSYGVSLEKVATITSASLGTGENIRIYGPIYDEADDGVVLPIIATSASHMVKYIGSTKLWQSDIPVVPSSLTNRPASTLRYGVYGFIAGTNSYTINTRDGSWDAESCWTNASGSGSQFYTALDHSVTKVHAGGFYKFYLNRGTGDGVPLSEIVADICDRAGFDSDEYNVTQLTDTVQGFLISRQAAARASLEPLAQAYLFDGAESDYVLKFVKRGGSSVDTMGEDDLIGTGDYDNPWEETRGQEVELPEVVTINYMDREADYEQGSQYSKRISNPVGSMFSHNQLTLNLPIVMLPNEALQLSEKTLYAAWVERSRYAASLSWKFLLLDPTDVFECGLGDTVYTGRITSLNVGVDLMIQLEALSDDTAMYVSVAEAPPNYGFDPQSIITDAPTKMFLLNIPLLRDYDDLGGNGSRIYFGLGSYAPDVNPWPGAMLYKSLDALLWDWAASGTGEAIWGTTTTALAEPDSPWRTDEESQLTVYMVHGADALESITQEQLVNGYNGAVVGDEIINFRDVTANADGSYTLTGLLRGRRGTDVFVGDHVAGETFILLNTATIQAFTLTVAEIDATRYYRAPTSGTLFEDASIESFTGLGRDLMPYAPVQLDAVYDGSDIDITWVRRTRLAGELRDGTGTVPVSEESESYEVDIVIADIVVRTLTSTSPEVTYTAAQQATDGFTGGNLTFVVYQMSAVVGRGFGREATVDMGGGSSSTTTTTS